MSNRECAVMCSTIYWAIGYIRCSMEALTCILYNEIHEILSFALQLNLITNTLYIHHLNPLESSKWLRQAESSNCKIVLLEAYLLSVIMNVIYINSNKQMTALYNYVVQYKRVSGIFVIGDIHIQLQNSTYLATQHRRPRDVNIAKGTTDPRVEFISQVQTQILIKCHLQNLE